MKVVLIGYGKMGREIHRILVEQGYEVPLIIDKDNSEMLCEENLRGVDIAIEFSTPATALDNVRKCLENGVAVVSGTTGWDVEAAKELCLERGGKMLWASNFSIGVNILFAINKQLAHLMNQFNGYDVTLEEVHHTAKLDAPSGTAVTLAEGVLDNLDRKSSWVLGHTTVSDELGVAALRRSVVAGEHTVVWESAEDYIELKHSAKGRVGFASGAVVAAKFLSEQSAGIYTMNDIMGTSKN